MKFLVDTHVLLWLQGAPDRLGKHTLDTIFQGENRIYVSILQAVQYLEDF